MKLLSPISRVDEVEDLIAAGADEFYCGVMPSEWRRSYSNLAALNRREWSVSNLNSFGELDEIRKVTRSRKIPLYLTLNALYTKNQNKSLERLVKQLQEFSPDAFIVADLGLLMLLRELKTGIPVHASTGCTVFNVASAKFFQALGASRVIIPRQNNLREIMDLAEKIDFMEKEVFIFNSGCRNIDGFCTFHHGVQEILKSDLWKIPKQLGLDYQFLSLLRMMPPALASNLTRKLGCMPDSACLLNYKIEFLKGKDHPEAKKLKSWLKRNLNFYFGLDSCGACALYYLRQVKVDSLKIVGRENPSEKKIKDLLFLRRCLAFLEEHNPSPEPYFAFCRKQYHEIYGFPCRDWCYYPLKDEGLEKLTEGGME